ncbi:MAG: WYL domain-containing protein [Flavobacteriales bacterium]
MPVNKYALLRYRIIDRCLKNSARPFPSREDLRSACEEALYGSGGDAISISTIDKDIWAMKNEGELGYYAPIAFNRSEGGYYYTDPEYAISEMSLGDEDLQALRFAVATLDQFKEVPLFQQYESAIEKIISRVNISPRPDEDSLDKFIQFEKSTVSKGREYLGTLLDAIRKKKVVKIDYRKFQDNTLKTYELHPYLLKEYGNRWYLISWNVKRRAVATFGLERIEKITTTKESFKVDANFDPDIIFKHSIGITESQEIPSEVVLSCNVYTGRFLMSQPIHSSQRLLSENSNEIQIALHICPTEEFYSLILGMGPSVEVISPKPLKSEVQRRIKAMSQLYSK